MIAINGFLYIIVRILLTIAYRQGAIDNQHYDGYIKEAETWARHGGVL